MAQRFYSMSLEESSFPMLSELQHRTVIGAAQNTKESIAQENPAVSYCHNVMPIKEGYVSVGYTSTIPAITSLPAGVSAEDVRIIYGDNRTRIHLCFDSTGGMYSLLFGATSWKTLLPTIPAINVPTFDINNITIGTVNGVSYIFYSKVGIFTYDEITDLLVSVPLTGINIADTIGIVASSGYLIAYTDRALAWSSTILPTDFVPSRVSGAGGGNVAGIAGPILFCTANTLGILIHSFATTIAGTYTGNSRYPFKFREVDNSKGGTTLDQVAYEANNDPQFIYSKAGLQAVTSRSAADILPAVTDFLAGQRLEDYDEITGQYTVNVLTTKMKKKIKFISSRYLVISYGITAFTHALVYDTSLKRLGKLKITHTDVFDYASNQVEVAKDAIAFLLSTGEIKTLSFSATGVSSGVIALGKLQFVRSSFVTLLGVEVETIGETDSLSVSSQVSLDGKNFVAVPSSSVSVSPGLREYLFRAQGKNHTLLVIGKFRLTTVQVRYSIAGKR